MRSGTVDGHEDKERHQAQDERDGNDGAHRGGQPAGWPGPPQARLRPERLGSRLSFIPGQPGKDREHRPELRLATFQGILDPVENALLTDRQTHPDRLPGKGPPKPSAGGSNGLPSRRLRCVSVKPVPAQTGRREPIPGGVARPPCPLLRARVPQTLLGSVRRARLCRQGRDCGAECPYVWARRCMAGVRHLAGQWMAGPGCQALRCAPRGSCVSLRPYPQTGTFRAPVMIAGRFGQIRPTLAYDHEQPARAGAA
jgi:hypothetical protein